MAFTVTPVGAVITTTAGTVPGNTITGITAGTDITITATSAINGTCQDTLLITAPNCACPFIAHPTTPNNPSICFGTATPALSVVLPGTPALGDDVNWYANATGRPALATGITYTPADTAIGVYTYYAEAEETVSGCLSTRIPVVLTIETPANAGTDGAVTICDDSTTTIDLFTLITGEDTGGAWTQTSGTGGTFNAIAGTYTPAVGATTSTFDYTVTGAAPCPDDVSTATITINETPVLTFTSTTCAANSVNLRCGIYCNSCWSCNYNHCGYCRRVIP